MKLPLWRAASLAVLLLLRLDAFAATLPESGAPSAAVCENVGHPKKEGGTLPDYMCWIARTSDDWYFYQSQFYGNAPVYANTLPDIRRLSEALRSRGVRLVLIPVPSKGLVHAEKFLSSPNEEYRGAAKYAVEQRDDYVRAVQTMNANGIATIDVLSAALRRAEDRRTGESFYMKGDGHWSPFGARVTARAVRDAARKLGLPIGSASFTTTALDPAPWTGYTASLVRRGCEADVNPEVRIDYVTSERGAGELDLFAETRHPYVLVGTSFSNHKQDFNFAGFLQEELRERVYNAAYGGADYIYALQDYLRSAEYRESPPDVILWEYNTGHTMRGGSASHLIRQIVPTVFHGCDGAEVVYENTMHIAANTNNQGWSLPAGATERGGNYFVSLEFSDPTVTAFKLVTNFINSPRDIEVVRRFPRLRNRGAYVIDFPAIGSRMTTLKIYTGGKIPETDATLKVCRAPSW